MDVTPSGSIAITGEFLGTVDLGGAPLTSQGLDVFVARFDSAGNHVWSESYGGTGVDTGTGIAFVGAQDVLVSGIHGPAADFGGGALSTVGGQDMFVAQLGGGGAHVWSKGLGSTGSEFRSYVESAPDGDAVLDIRGATGIDFGAGPLAGTYYLARLEGDSTGTVAVAPRAGAASLQLSASPNPFGARTVLQIQGALPADGRFALTIFDAAGRRVRRFTDLRPATSRTVEWDGTGETGQPVTPGLYFVRLEGAGQAEGARVVRF